MRQPTPRDPVGVIRPVTESNPVSDKAVWPAHLEPVADLLCCPVSGSPLRWADGHLVAESGGATYPMVEGVPLLAVEGSVAGWSPGVKLAEDSTEYQQAYREVEEAESYNREYRQKLFKRWSTAGEYRLLDRLLGSQGHSEVLLDLPSGGGRLSPRIAAHADLLLEADIGLGQVLYGRRQPPLATPQIWMTASAFHIPLRDASVDGAVCCRLCHHLPSAEERERLIGELLRVSRRFVIMTFFDYHSLKNRLRRLRAPFNRKPPKLTMTVERVRQLAEVNGARLEACPMLSPTSSGHRYALLVKD